MSKCIGFTYGRNINSHLLIAHNVQINILGTTQMSHKHKHNSLTAINHALYPFHHCLKEQFVKCLFDEEIVKRHITAETM